MATEERTDTNEASDPAEWVDRHGDALYRYALLRVGDPATAEELVQECLAGALGAREQFAARSSERTWLIGILKRKVVDHIRREARRSSADEPELDAGGDTAYFTANGKWAAGPARWGGDPEALLKKREFWDVFRRCLGNLPDSAAQPFLLRELDEISSEEVCKVLDLSTTNLWTRLHRARLSLRACLETHWFGGKKASC